MNKIRLIRTLCLGLILSVLGSHCFGKSLLTSGAIPLEDEWQMRWGDSPVGEDGQFLWLGEEWQDPAWETTDLPYYSFKQLNEIKKAWIRIKLPPPPVPLGLYLGEMTGIFEVFQNKELIYRSGTLTAGDDIHYLGKLPHLITLKPHSGTQIISFRVHSNMSAIGTQSLPVHLVDPERTLTAVMVDDLDNLLFGSLYIFLGLFSLLLFVRNTSDKVYLGYGIFTLGMGAWNWATTVILHRLVDAPDLWFYVDRVGFYAATAGFFYFVEQIVNADLKKYARFLWVSHVMCLMAAAVQDQIPGMNWSDANMWYYYYQPTSYVAGLIILSWNVRIGGDEARQLFASLVVLIVLSVIETVQFKASPGASACVTDFACFYRPGLLPIGIFVMVVVQGRILLQRYANVQRKLEQYSSQLEKRSLELEDSNKALVQMDRLKNEFLANTSHELRTPLHGMTGLAEGMLEGIQHESREDIQKNLSLMVRSGQRLSHLIDDILDFSRMEHDDLNLEMKAVDIQSIVEVIFVLCQPLVFGKDVRLEMDIPGDCPPVEADENRLQQILYNLLGNAIKFTHEGEVRVTVKQVNEKLQLQIIDTGIGMDATHLESIFEPFQQVDSITKSYQGIGLGLSITKKLVEMHKGEIFAESTMGRGSCFTLLLPVSSGPLSAIETQKVESQPALPVPVQIAEHDYLEPELQTNTFYSETLDEVTGARQVHHILAVDDDPVNLQVVINHLTPKGYRVTTAVDGLEALEIIEDDGPFDLVILDLMMPQMNGYETCEHIREQFDPSELPIILLTARSQTEDLVLGLQKGANDYLTKPFAKEELLARVQGHLQLKDAHIQLQDILKLRQEIQLREQATHQLILAQQRLSQILNHMDDAVCAFSPEGTICFLNTPAITQFGLNAEELMGQPITALIPEYDSEEVMSLLQPWKSGAGGKSSLARALSFSLNSIDISVDVLHWETPQENGGVLIFSPVTYSPPLPEHSTISLPARKSALDRRLHYLELSTETLFAPGEACSPATDANVASSQDIRRWLVDILNKVVNLWESTTSRTKVELAEESGLWPVHLERRGVFRVRTMDRHRRLDTLPKSPRWQIIMQTTQYVLENCAGDKSLRDTIEADFESLKTQLNWEPESVGSS